MPLLPCLMIPAMSTGGARCTVLENSCSSMPGKAFPPPSPNIFWQVTSRDDQGWDFCADPTYDKERAAQPNDTAVALAALPVNVRGGVSLTTQAGCTCSPLNWTYYPAVIQDGERHGTPGWFCCMLRVAAVCCNLQGMACCCWHVGHLAAAVLVCTGSHETCMWRSS